MLVGIGDTKFIKWYSITVAVSNLLLSLLLVRWLGILGVILGTVVPFYIGFVVWTAHTLRAFQITLGEWVRGIGLRTYPLLAVSAIVYWSLAFVGVVRTAPGVLGSVSASIVAYWLAFYFLGLRDADSQAAGVRPGKHAK
jgi:O-antigen/teichoic acid export membrane protein